jgi:predicted nucleotidyltransferase
MTENLQLDPEELAAFCRKWKIRELSLFGSVLRDDFGPDSDIDVLVSFDPDVSLDIDSMLQIIEELEARYGRPVDIVEREALRNPWRREHILSNRKVIYAA